MMHEDGGLWYEMIKAMGGNILVKMEPRPNNLLGGGTQEGCVGGGWFDDNMVSCVGDVGEIVFWKHRWVGEERLMTRFSRSFRNSMQKDYVSRDLGK